MGVISLWLAAAIAAAPCEVDAVKAECGTVHVPEDRSTKGGRTIDIAYAIIPATPGKKSAGAIFPLAGGPGQAASVLGGFVSRLFAGSGRDVVLVDSRGTGKSNPLHCDFGGSKRDPAGYFNDMLPIVGVQRCREELAAKADLAQYTTRAIVEDLEAVRAHLGYAKIDLYGTSYGTRVAQEMMRYHPDHLRLVILDGVVSPSAVSPVSFAPDAQRSLDAVLEMCRSDAACTNAFPNLAADYQAMIRAVGAGFMLPIEDPHTKKPINVKISRGFFGEVFRNFLYSPERYTRVPAAIHAATQNDWRAFSELAVGYAVGIRTLDFGMFLSVTCTRRTLPGSTWPPPPKRRRERSSARIVSISRRPLAANG